MDQFVDCRISPMIKVIKSYYITMIRVTKNTVISQAEKDKNLGIKWNIKQKIRWTNRKEKKNIDIDNRVMIARSELGKGGQIYGNKGS